MPANLEEYLSQMKANQEIILKACEKTINSTAQTIYKKIVERTPLGNPSLWHPPYWPKDYQPGTLKASWHISFNNQQHDLSTGKFTSTSSMIGGHGISLTMSESNTGKNAVIYNNQPYAERVEYGSWSTQAPAGMMRVTVAEYNSIIDEEAMKYRIA